MNLRQQLDDVRRVVSPRHRQRAALLSHRMLLLHTVRLRQERCDGRFTSIQRQLRAAGGVEGA